MGTARQLLLVGVDGSPDSRRAFEWAVQEATLRNLRLELVSALPVVAITGEWADEHRRRAGEMLTQLVDEATESGLRDTVAQHVRSGAAAAMLERAHNAAMVVVGGRGLGALGGPVLGSVSQHVARHAPCPVVVVRAAHDPRATRLVVGVDQSPPSDDALGFAFDEASRRGCDLYVVHAYEHVTIYGSGGMLPISENVAAEQAIHESALATQLDPWREKCPGVAVYPEAIAGHAARVLADTSEHAAMVVVGSRGRGGFASLLLGSVSMGLLHRANCPVAVVR